MASWFRALGNFTSTFFGNSSYLKSLEVLNLKLLFCYKSTQYFVWISIQNVFIVIGKVVCLWFTVSWQANPYPRPNAYFSEETTRTNLRRDTKPLWRRLNINLRIPNWSKLFSLTDYCNAGGSELSDMTRGHSLLA